MSNTTATAYDEVLYPGNAFAQTHPDRLATVANLFGMAPASIQRCRVLELGCGDGGNLLPMAFSLPGSEFIGLDLAARPIAKGQAVANALALKNVTLRALDVREVSRDYGLFDYIIAHGLYSWVPPDVQDKIMAICRDNLAPGGVAYVSYNAYPGCRQSQMVREILLYYAREFADPAEQIGQALAFARFLKDAHPTQDAYACFLREELERVCERSDHLLYHDDLAPINMPVYFHQFATHAGRHGLQFLAESDFFEMQDHIYPPEVTEQLRRMAGASIVAKEQYLDFLKCRRFRQTLLCHQEVKVDRTMDPQRLTTLHMASVARPVADNPDLHSPAAEVEFRGQKGAVMTTDYPLAKAAVFHLGTIWPQSLSFPELVTQSRSLLGQASLPGDPCAAEDAQVLAEILFQTYMAGLVELYREPPRFAAQAGERPLASALARLQIQNQEPFITNLRHANVNVEEPLARGMVWLLDGTRDRPALLAELAGLVSSGAAPLVVNGQPITDPGQIASMLQAGLEPNLAKLARLALLVR
jgi:methyltransferase-like protein/cyclopropane fatty-acyl-phospholipid synthase-like methyltransferase